MSWLQRPTPYRDFSAQAQLVPTVLPHSPWTLEIFEVTKDTPDGRRSCIANVEEADLTSDAKIRIIFAPLDLPRRDALLQTTSLFRQLNIPDEFTTERTIGACHSFGKRTEERGFSSWFHFLCKNIELKLTDKGGVGVRNRAAELGYLPPTELAEADYSWNRSGFFLRFEKHTGVTLVCFGAISAVRRRLEEFIAARAWEDVEGHPYLLFDVVLEGLYFEVEETIRKMTKVFNSHEHETLSILNGAIRRKFGARNPFTGLHNCAKHVIHISEAVESCLLLSQSILSASDESKNTKTPPLAAIQLQETLQYRLSLFRSTQLKLASLQKRITNTINLSFNLVTQQDSLIMTQDSTTMRVIAAITMIFLPTTCVAAVAGSQLFITTRDEGRWEVLTTPLFWLTWWVSIPLTVLVVSLAWLFHKRGHNRRIWWGLLGMIKRWKRGLNGSRGEKG